MKRCQISVAVCCLALSLLCVRGAGAAPPAKALSAEAVLDRYVQVTGGQDLYRRFGSFSMYSTVTRADGTTFNTVVSHTREGATRTEIDDDADPGQSGITNGVVWESSQKKGAKVLTGKAAERRIAEARGLDPDDWRTRFPAVKLAGTEMVNGKSCHHLKLTRTDNSTVDRFYDSQSGLLVREIATEFDDSGREQAVTTDIEDYRTWLRVTHPSLMQVKEGNKSFTVRVDSLTYFPGSVLRAAEIPREVARAVAERRGGGGLPNPVDLIQRYIDSTGGKNAYQAIRTMAVKAEMTVPNQNVKFPLLVYSSEGKMYTSFDIPSVGKFEVGNDGTTGWERSVVMGPRLQPRSKAGGFFGPDPHEVLGWTETDLNLQTLGKDAVNGSPCYTVKMGPDVNGRAGNTACFDAETGLLVKSTTNSMEGTVVAALETKFSDYRAQGDFKTPYHLETKLAGQEMIIDVKEMTINAPLPQGVFELPADVRALRDKKQSDANKADGESSDRPSLKKK